MDNTEIIMQKIERLDIKLQGVVNQLDLDRRDIDNLRIDQGAIKDGQKAILSQLTDFKTEIRQQVQDTIIFELQKSVKREIRLLSEKHPRKQISGRIGILEKITGYFKK